MTRPDFALQIMLRAMSMASDPQDDPDYQLLSDAIKELKRLYKVEMFVVDLLENPADVERCDGDLKMLADLIRKEKQ